MPVKIIPSILASTPARFTALSKRFGFASGVHIDIMDGSFVRSRSIGPSILRRQQLTRAGEVHLMVQDPSTWMEAVTSTGARRVILHVESRVPFPLMAAVYRTAGYSVVPAINPATPLAQASLWIKSFRQVHVMLGRPGHYGAPIMPAMIRRVREIHRRWPKAVISVDIGVTPKTIPALVRAGARRLVVGSYLADHSQPAEAMKALQRISNQTLRMVE